MIRVRIAPLDSVEAEALLRPVASNFSAVTAEGRAVEVKAGLSIRERLEALGELPVGGAVVTPGGDLDSDFLIHVVVQSADEAVSRMGVRRALLNGLRRASEWGVHTLALPPLGTGAGNLETDVSARVMVPMLREHLRDHDLPAEVTVAVAGVYEEEIFLAAIERADEDERAAEEIERTAAGNGDGFPDAAHPTDPSAVPDAGPEAAPEVEGDAG